MKNPLTLAGIEPATFRFVAQHLNHCTTEVPLSVTGAPKYICVERGANIEGNQFALTYLTCCDVAFMKHVSYIFSSNTVDPKTVSLQYSHVAADNTSHEHNSYYRLVYTEVCKTRLIE